MASRDKIADAEECKDRGNECLQKKDFEKAIQWYTEALKLHENHVYYSNRSAAYLSKGFAESALKDADKCIKLNPDWPKGYSRKGAALHKLKQYEKSIEAYKKGLEFEPDNIGLKQGLEAVEEEKQFPYGRPSSTATDSEPSSGAGNPLDGMFSNIMTAVQSSPKLRQYLSDPSYVSMITNIQSNPSLAQNYMHDPRFLETFQAMLGLNPDAMDFAAGINKQREEEEKKKKEEEEKKKKEREQQEKERKEKEEFDSLSEEEKEKHLNKRKAEEFKVEGNNLYKAKKFDEALEKYETAIQLDPTNMLLLLNKSAVLLEKIKDDTGLSLCIETCEKAVQVGRENHAEYANIAKAYARMGNAYMKHEKYDLAVESYKKAQLEQKNNDVARLLKDAEAKKKIFEEKSYIDPEKAKIAKEEGNEKFKAGAFPEAVKFYTEAVKRDPQNAMYYNNRAAAYMKLADFGRAMDDCKKAIQLDKKYVKAYSRKGNIELFLKEYHKAMDTFKAGLAIEPENQECKDGLNKTMFHIQNSMSQGGEGTPQDQELRARRAMEDPEIRNMLSDPVMKSILQDMSTDPKSAQKHMMNPEVASKIEKLIAAGIIRTG